MRNIKKATVSGNEVRNGFFFFIFHSRIIACGLFKFRKSENINLTQTICTIRGIHRKRAHIFYASSGIRTTYHTVRTGENILRLRLHGHCVRTSSL